MAHSTRWRNLKQVRQYEYEVAAVIPAGQPLPATFYKVPVAFEWALDNYVDDAETTQPLRKQLHDMLANII